MTDEKTISKIRKLLALRDRAGTEGEAMAAAAQAARLLAQAGLNEAEVLIDTDEDGRLLVGELVHREERSRRRPFVGVLFGGLAQLCGCFSWYERQRDSSGKTVCLRYLATGRPTDLDTVRALAPAMLATVEQLRSQHTGPGKDSYALGLVVGLVSRMQAEQNEVLSQIRRPGLVPVTRAESAEAATRAEVAVHRWTKARGRADSFGAGEADSANVKIAGQHAAISGGRALGPAS